MTILRFNPQSRSYVRQGQNGKFAPKVMGALSRTERQVTVLPASQPTKTVLTNRQGQQ